MLTRTTEMAIRALMVLALDRGEGPITPRLLATRLDCSHSYLSKTLGLLTKAGILESVRGSHGGVLLRRAPVDISLEGIVAACQGIPTANFCRRQPAPTAVCGFHAAMRDLHETTMTVLGRWTLADMLHPPVQPDPALLSGCKMYFHDCEQYCAHPEHD